MTEENEQEFKILPQEELIKQEFCTFGLDEKENSCFICACSSIEFTPICSYCFMNCHNNGREGLEKEHKHSLITKIKGVFECGCGKRNHNCSDKFKMQQRVLPVCIYSKFLKGVVDHPGFYQLKDLSLQEEDYCCIAPIVCVFCIQCVQNKNDYVKMNNPDKNQICECTKHEESNAMGLVFEFIKAVKSYAYKKMKNFNPNIISKIYNDRVYHKETLTELILNYLKMTKSATPKIIEEENKKFFQQYNFFNILKTISITLDLTRNPHFSLSKDEIIKTSLQSEEEVNEEEDSEEISDTTQLKIKSKSIRKESGIDINILINIFSNNSSKSFQQEFDLNQFQSYFEAKFYFAELIYNLYFKTYLLKHNNYVANIQAIESMDVLQRYIYFNQAKSFKNFKLNSPKENSKSSNEKIIFDSNDVKFENEVNLFFQEVMSVLENMVGNFKDKIILEDIQIAFSISNRIMKELIKYNLINSEQTYRYFTLVQDAFKLQRRNPDSKSTSPKQIGEKFIIKSIYYSILHTNDKEVVNALRGDLSKNYNFSESKEMNLISNVFLKTVNSMKNYLDNKIIKTNVKEFENNINLKRIISDQRKNRNILKFDIYVHRILDMLAANSNIYLKSLNKIKFVDKEILDCFTSTTEYSQTQSQLIEILRRKEDIYNNIMNFSTNLTKANEDYFHYREYYEDYVKQVVRITDNFKTFINDNINAIPLQNKYNNTTINDFGDENSIKNLTMIKNVSKYSNIFQALNGFFYIFAENKIFQEKIHIHTIGPDDIKVENRYYSSKETMLGILSYLFSIFWNDNQSFSLISTFNPRNFVISFIECEAYFYYFLENMMDASFGKMIDGNSMNNYSFYASLITELINLIDFSYFEKKTEIEPNDEKILIKLIDLLSSCFKLCVKPLRNLNVFRNRLIDLIEIILYKIEQLKKNVFFNDQLETFFKGHINLFYESCTSDVKLILDNKNKSIQTMLKNYFQLMNEIMDTDLKFYGIVKPELHYIRGLDQIYQQLKLWKEESLTEKNGKIKSIILELTMRTFLHKNLYNYNLNPDKIKEIYPESRDTEKYDYEVEPSVPVYLKNYFLRDKLFGINEDTNNSTIVTDMNDLKKKADYLIDLMKLDSHSFFQNVLTCSKEIKSLLKRRILLLNYFENTYVRSAYNLVNQFLFKGENLSGEECFKIYEIVFNLLKCIYIFYIEIVSIDVLEDDVAKELNIFEKEEFDLYMLENIYMYFPKEEEEKNDFLNNYVKEILTADIKRLTDGVKYFEIEEVLEIFKKHLQRILICDEMTKSKVKSRIKENSGKRYKDVFMYLIEKFQDSKELKKTGNICDRVIGDFINKSNKCKELKRALIKSISISQNEHFDNLGVGLYEYLVKKSLHLLTYANCSINFTTLNNKDLHITYGNFMNTIASKSFNLQNIYVINLFNSLFYHDASTSQKIFYTILNKEFQQEVLEENKKNESSIFPLLNFIKFIFCNTIFCSIIYECSKIYKIDRITNSNMICFQLIQECIKFLQNLCEGHNTFFQTLLFKMDVIINDVKTPIINLAMESMSLLIFHSHFRKESIFHKNRIFKDFYILTALYERLADLLIEMSQGTPKKAYRRFFDKVPVWRISNNNYKSQPIDVKIEYGSKIDNEDEVNLVTHSQEKNYSVTLEMLFKQIKELFTEKSNILLTETIGIKIKLFQIINNIIVDCDPNLTNTDKRKPHEIMIKEFDPDELIQIVTFYFKALYLTSVQEKNFKEKKLGQKISEMQTYIGHLSEMRYLFSDPLIKISNQPYFKLGINLFMFITLIADKFENEAAVKIRNYGQKLDDLKSGPEDVKNLDNNTSDEKVKKVDNFVDEYQCKIFAAGFFGNLIKKCEFVIRQNSGNFCDYENLKKILSQDGSDICVTNLQTQEKEIDEDFQDENVDNEMVRNVYFTIDYRSYSLPEENIYKFLDKVERSTPTIKLKELLEQIDKIYSEIKYKEKQNKLGNIIEQNKESLFQSDYELNKMNLIVSLIINAIIIFTFSDDNFFSSYNYYLILLACMGLIICNMIFIYYFMKIRYPFLVKMEKLKNEITSRDREKLKDPKMFLKIYITETILIEENYLSILNIVIPLICLVSNKAIILFPLQLLTIIKFVDVIKDIVKAFTYKVDELLVMVAFLGILILFYTNLGFFFMASEFEMDLDDGSHINACDSLLNCLVTYFNFGIRSGGGIGDVIGPQPYSETYSYSLRFVFDMIFYITVILLIMNMINGIIISTFGALREENEKKEEDIQGKCFICSLSKSHFEKYKINFEEHKEKEHKLGNYLKYFIILKMKDDRELNSEESFIKNSISKKDIGFFPVLKAKILQEIPDYQFDDEEAEE